jgi:Matrixin/Bacterial Ig-like domain
MRQESIDQEITLMFTRLQWPHPFRNSRSRRQRSGNPAKRSTPQFESLETRMLLYSASGNAWPNPTEITISFMPDGTNLGGGVSSNLQSTFNSKPSLNGKWENVILQAAQTWAQQTNINFTLVTDNGAASGSGVDEQGNPGIGDIRIGGYNFNDSTLALTFEPPPVNNFSLGGDMTFNTGQSFNIGSTYDLFTVAMHEFGHALGLNNESSVPNAVMYGTYTNKKTGLVSDDIAGIQSIYGGARSQDTYGGSNNTLGSATSISSLINTGTMTALVPDLAITTAGQSEYFSFAAPTGTGSTLDLDVQSSGLSLLAPKMTVYASNGSTVLASASGAGLYGTTLTTSVTSVTPGEVFYVKVQGADTTQMGTGKYALGLNFLGSTPPVEASPIVAEPNGNPEQSGGGQADGSNGKGPYVDATPVITGITPDNGVSSQDGITNSPHIAILGSAAAGDLITVTGNGKTIGQTIVLPNNTFEFFITNALSDGTYKFTVVATDAMGYSTPASYPYQVVIDTHVPDPPVLADITPDTGANNTDGITDVRNPTFSGSSEPFAIINLYTKGSPVPFGTAAANILGLWSYTLPGGGWPDGTYWVTATATDIAGTTSGLSRVERVVIDTQQPQYASGTLSGQAIPGSSVTILDGDIILGVATADSSGNWQFIPSLSKGHHSIMTETSASGNPASLLSAALNVNI